MTPLAGEGDELDLHRDARLEADARAGGHGQSAAHRGLPIELQCLVGLREVEVRTDLHRAVAGVEHGQRHQLPALEQHDVAVAEEDLAGDEPGGTVVGGARSERRRLDRSVQGHELGPVGEGRLGLELVDQRLHPLHHVGGVEHVAPGGHDLRDRHAVAGRLEHPGGEHRHRLGVVEQQPALPAAPRHLRRAGDHQPFLFVGGEQHPASVTRGGRRFWRPGRRGLMLPVGSGRDDSHSRLARPLRGRCRVVEV